MRDWSGAVCVIMDMGCLSGRIGMVIKALPRWVGSPRWGPSVPSVCRLRATKGHSHPPTLTNDLSRSEWVRGVSWLVGPGP